MVSQIDVPGRYWWAVAVGWVVLGAISDLDRAWLTTAATLASGAVHSAIAPRVVTGRHRSDRLSVRAEVAAPHIGGLVIGALVVIAGVTVVVALLLDADGAGHPTTAAGVVVATVIVLGGPLLMTRLRERAARVGS